MKAGADHEWHGWRVGLAGSAVLLLLATVSAAQEAPKRVVPFEGTQAFQHLLRLAHLKPLPAIAALEKGEPKEIVLVVFGNPAPLAEISVVVGGLDHFLRAGGNLLLAADRRCFGPLQEIGLLIDGRPVAPIWEGRTYRNIAPCPLLTTEQEPNHPLFAGVERGIAANNPSWISWHFFGRRWRSLVSVPQREAPAEDRPFLRRFAMPRSMLICSRREDTGRAVILSGHGVFLNGMLALPDADNFQFADNTVRWLTEGDTRKYVLLVEEGRVRQNLDVPLTVPPSLPIPSEKTINTLLQGMEKENLFNRAILQLVGRPRVVRGLFLLLTVLLLAVLLWRLFRSRHRLENRLPLVSQVVAKTAANTPTLARRQTALIRSGNLWEPARTVARQWLEMRLAPAATPPRVQASGWWARWRWQGRLNQLWQLAYGSPQSVSPVQFRRWLALLKLLETGLQQGQLRFVAAGR